MSDFAPWLRNNPTEDMELARLHEFVDNHGREWPYYSNKLSDFIRVIIVSRDKNEAHLLDTLERYYINWSNSPKIQARGGFWSNFGPLALFLVGMIASLFLLYEIYAPSLLASMRQPEQTRGLMTFLLAFSATSVIVAVAIGMLWVDKGDISSGFAKAKDISTILIGVLGTILVFYFVSASGATPAERHVWPNAGSSLPPPQSAAEPAAAAPNVPSALPVPPIAPAAPSSAAAELSAPVIPLLPSVASVPSRHHGRP